MTRLRQSLQQKFQEAGGLLFGGESDKESEKFANLNFLEPALNALLTTLLITFP